ncbi:Hypothetical predicted protein [Mytilus galloprovincialis]|uniref:KCTD1_15 n=1 Tax=Mytilus galloprovincialis TaxID=29158 RepID=A0A8B6ETH6_MYTGA|nr:Hypothetical predicted protein [Mytilus galloprovincialis]
MESGKRRFVDTSSEEIEQKRLKMSADKTIKQNIAAATIFREYLKVKKMDPGFEQYNTLKLDEMLDHFYMDSVTNYGRDQKINFEKSTLHGIITFLWTKTLGNFMSYLIKKCNLSEIYTNHSIRATGATVQAKNSYCNAQIMAVTRHKSVASLSLYQRVDNDDKIRMGQTLTESITEPSKALALTAGETSSNIRALPSSSCTMPPKTLAIGASSTFLPLPNITTACTTLMSTERSSETYNVGQKTLYTSAKEYKAPPLSISGPFPCNTFKPKHLSTTKQGNTTQSFHKSLQGVNLNELFNDFTETAVNINRTTLCPEVFNNCSVTIIVCLHVLK